MESNPIHINVFLFSWLNWGIKMTNLCQQVLKSLVFLHGVLLYDLQQKCQNMETELELEQYCLVERCMELSPSCKQSVKRSAGKREGEASPKQLLFGETTIEVSESDQPGFVERLTLPQ